MLPMLITLPGPGSTPPSIPQAIDVEVLHATPDVAAGTIAEPATTSALPEVKATAPSPAPIEAPAEARTERPEPDDRPAMADETSPGGMGVTSPHPLPSASEPASVEATADEAATAGPAARPPTEVKEATSPEPETGKIASPEAEVKEAASEPEVKEASHEPEVITATSPALGDAQIPSNEPHEANEQPSEPPAIAITPTPELQPQPEVARAQPTADTPAQEPAAVTPTPDAAPESNTPVMPKVDINPEKPAPNAEATPHKKPAPKAQARIKAPAKTSPGASRRHPVATAKPSSPRPRRVVRATRHTPAQQAAMPLFGGLFGPPANKPVTTAPRRPAAAESKSQH